MKYELTKDLETGNKMIDQEHRQLFDALNKLMDACQKGKGRDQIEATAKFLSDYVNKHFSDEEKLQLQTKYPGYQGHKAFHEGYKKSIAAANAELIRQGATISALAELNKEAGILVTHIRTEDKKLAAHVKNYK